MNHFRNKKTVAFAGAVLVFLVLYLSGLAAQVFRNYALWQQAGNFLGSKEPPKLPSTDLSAVLTGLFSFPFGLYGLLVTLGGIAAAVFFGLRIGRDAQGEYDNERNLIYSEDGTYGTAGYMSPKEFKGILEMQEPGSGTGVILGKQDGKAVCLPENTPLNQNIMVYGASGTRKSRAFVRNRIFQAVVRGESLIITDPKSELYSDCSEYLRAHGYEVRVFNLVNPECSDSWDCLGEVHKDELMVQTFAEVVISNSNDGNGDRFWDDIEGTLFKALILYVDHNYAEGQRTLAAVYDLLTSTQGKALEAVANQLANTHPAKPYFNIFLQSSESVRSGAITGLAGRLQTLQTKSIRSITSYPEIDLTLPGREKCAYFCITSDQENTFEFLSSLFFSFLFIKLTRFADSHCEGGRLPVPVHIIGDELMNAGKIPLFGRRLSVIRSRGISVSCIVQSLGQLQNRYPDNEWVEIVGNCSTAVFLGCTDDLTAEFISNRSGDITVAYSTEAKVFNTLQLTKWSPQYRETHSVGKRKLLTPDEVLRLPIDQELIILQGQKVLKCEKFDYTGHPHAQLLQPVNAIDHIPVWRQKSPAPMEAIPAPQAPKSTKSNGRRKPVPKSDIPLQISDSHSIFQ